MKEDITARGLRLWLTMQVAGAEALSDAIEHGFMTAEYAKSELRKDPDGEILSPARLALLTFRYAPHICARRRRTN